MEDNNNSKLVLINLNGMVIKCKKEDIPNILSSNRDD